MSQPYPSYYSPLNKPSFSNSKPFLRNHTSPTRKLRRFLSVSKLPTPSPPEVPPNEAGRHQDMVRSNDNSSDRSWQFTDSADWQGYYSPSSLSSHSSPPPQNNHQFTAQSYPSSPTDRSSHTNHNYNHSYAPSVSGASAYAPIPLSSPDHSNPSSVIGEPSISRRSTIMDYPPGNGGTKKLGFNPWKNKKLLQEAQAREAQRIADEQRREAVRKEEMRRYQDAIRKQELAHADMIKRQQREAAEIKAQLEHERRERQKQEDEERAKLAAQEAEKQRIEMLHRERESKRRAEALRRLKLNTPDALKSLRDLIRTRYELDMEIWRLRDVRAADREVVEKKMERADAVLDEILAIVGQWEYEEGEATGANGAGTQVWTAREWKLAREVKERLTTGEKRRWGENPPWDEDDGARGYLDANGWEYDSEDEWEN